MKKQQKTGYLSSTKMESNVAVRGKGHGQRRQGPNLSDEIQATLVDHVVINHGLTLREAGQRLQPNLSRYTVAKVIWSFGQEQR